MNLSDVEMFLAIVHTKSITKTAEALFLSQPTVSQRLKALEQELNFPLIVRSKGYKQIEITQEGLDFVPLAERMVNLWKESTALKQNRERPILNVGCADSVNLALLSPFYKHLLMHSGNLDLHIHTHQSSELYGILDKHEIDVAFVFYPLYYRNILSQKVIQEKFYLIQSQNPVLSKSRINPKELDPAMELFLKWDDPYQLWHDQWMSSSARPHVTVDTITMLDQLWDDDRFWAVAPESVIQLLSKRRPLFVSQLINPPHDRCCYKITHRSPLPTSQRALQLFEEQLNSYLDELKFDIPIGEVWQQV